MYGLEKFWAFLKYSRMKNQPIDPKLQEHLRQFKTLEDFRVVVRVKQKKMIKIRNKRVFSMNICDFSSRRQECLVHCCLLCHSGKSEQISKKDAK